MDELESPEVRPLGTYLEALQAFLKLEHVRPKGGAPSERAALRAEALRHLRLTDDQATAFQICEMLSMIAATLATFILFGGWLAQHGIQLGGSHGNWQGFAAVIGMMILIHAAASFVMALVWLRIRLPMDEIR